MKIFDGLDPLNKSINPSMAHVCCCYHGSCQNNPSFMNGYMTGVADATPEDPEVEESKL